MNFGDILNLYNFEIFNSLLAFEIFMLILCVTFILQCHPLLTSLPPTLLQKIVMMKFFQNIYGILKILFLTLIKIINFKMKNINYKNIKQS